MVDDTCLDLETSLERQIPNFFDKIPKELINDKPIDSFFDIVSKFSFCKLFIFNNN